VERTTQDFQVPIFFPENFRFECVGCCTCCIDWSILVESCTLEKLRNIEFKKNVEKDKGIDNILLFCSDTSEYHMAKINGRCAMLDDHKCRIHSELGMSFKPLGCRAFPIFMYSTPDGIYVGTSFICKSIRNNTGIPIEEYLDEIRGLLSEYDSKTIGDDIILAGDIQINWQGYKVVEDFLLKKINAAGDIGAAFFEVFMQLIILLVKCRMDSINRLSAKALEFILKDPMDLPFERDEMYRQQEIHHALMLVSIYEGLKSDEKFCNFSEAMKDGKIESRTFNKVIDIESLWEYARMNPCTWKDKEFLRYVNHLVWQKYLPDKGNILDGIVMMNLLYPFFDWYLYCSAYARGADKPDVEDARFALSILEINVKHASIGYFKSMAKAFCESLVKQVEIYVSDYVPEGYGETK
jgi:hypothetical protein